MNRSMQTFFKTTAQALQDLGMKNYELGDYDDIAETPVDAGTREDPLFFFYTMKITFNQILYIFLLVSQMLPSTPQSLRHTHMTIKTPTTCHQMQDMAALWWTELFTSTPKEPTWTSMFLLPQDHSC